MGTTTIKDNKVDEEYSYLKSKEPIIVLSKHRSPHIIELYEDPQNNWFIFFMIKNKKSKEFIHCSIIIRKDIADWIKYHNSSGWIVSQDKLNF